MRMRFIALASALLLFSLGWFFIGFKPAGSKLSEVKLQVETKRSEVAALEARLARLQELKRNAKQLREESARLDKGLPDKPAVQTFIRQVQQAANDAGINFLSIAPSTPAAASPAAAPAPAAPAAPADGSVAPAVVPAPLYTITMTMTAKGPFFNLEKFVSNLERLDRAQRIDTFSLSGKGELSLSTSSKIFMTYGAPVAPAAQAPAAPPVDAG